MPLVLVATPLGNLGDVTLRALQALRDASLIVSEDTRVTRKLLAALDIPCPQLWSYREHNAAGATPAILERARSERVALVSDAGMPAISDPGSDLVAAARAAGVPVEVLPGPSAALGVAVLSGFPLRRFGFEGFVPRAAGARRAAFARALGNDATSLWFESPQRIVATLRALAEFAPDARVFLVREYTKLHEQQLLGTPTALAAAFDEQGAPVRGEIAFAIAPYAAALPSSPDERAADDAIDALLAQGVRVAEIARALSAQGLGERNAIYARANARRQG